MSVISHRRPETPPPSNRRVALLDRFEDGEPHLMPGPFSRWPHAADAALAGVVYVASLVAVPVSALDDGEDFTIEAIGELPTGAFIMLALAAAALFWRRERPIPVTIVVMAIMTAWAVAGYGDGQDLAVVVAAYSVGRHADDYRQGLVVVTAVIALMVIDTLIDSQQRVDIAPAIILGGLPWYVGHRIRNRGEYLLLLRERAERLEADQHAEARRAVAAERTRIARELHDIVAHQVSMMTVQAGAAKTIARDDLDTAVEAMGDVESAGRQALGELRHLLGVLRPDTTDHDALGPQPGLGDLPALADELRHTGADVSLSITPLPGRLSAAVELSAYRIVQESVTNIIKHAGPTPTVELTMGIDGDELVITITNTAIDTDAAGLPGSGYGIAGMSERATLLGGTLTAGPRTPRHFAVEARIPVEWERA